LIWEGEEPWPFFFFFEEKGKINYRITGKKLKRKTLRNMDTNTTHGYPDMLICFLI
jgi:hypothetical protein